MYNLLHVVDQPWVATSLLVPLLIFALNTIKNIFFSSSKKWFMQTNSVTWITIGHTIYETQDDLLCPFANSVHDIKYDKHCSSAQNISQAL